MAYATAKKVEKTRIKSNKAEQGNKKARESCSSCPRLPKQHDCLRGSDWYEAALRCEDDPLQAQRDVQDTLVAMNWMAPPARHQTCSRAFGQAVAGVRQQAPRAPSGAAFTWQQQQWVGASRTSSRGNSNDGSCGSNDGYCCGSLNRPGCGGAYTGARPSSKQVRGCAGVNNRQDQQHQRPSRHNSRSWQPSSGHFNQRRAPTCTSDGW